MMQGFGAIGQFAEGQSDSGTVTTTVYGIGYNFSEPVRRAPRLNAALNPAVFYQPAPIISMAWFAALSEPVRFPKRINPALNPVLAIQPTPIINISWFAALSEPKRFKPALLAADQPYYSAEPEPEDLDVMGWFASLSEPKRFKPRLDPSQNPTVTTSQQNFYQPYARGYVIC